jgi:hypothetical protein
MLGPENQEFSSTISTTVFATYRSPEHNPRSKITGKILEPVFNVGGYKQTITRLERMTIIADNKLTCAFMDEVNLILFMRRLGIKADGRIILDRHAAMSKRNGESFTHGPLWGDGAWNAGKYFLKRCFNLQLPSSQCRPCLIIPRRLICGTARYFLERASKRRKKLAVGSQNLIKRERESTKDHAQKQARKRR